MLTPIVPPHTDIVGAVVLVALFVAVFVVAEVLWRRLQLETEHTRKLVHVGGGLIVLLVPRLLTSIWSALALAVGFAVVLGVARRARWLPSVHAIGRASVGAVVFPLAVAVCVIASRGDFVRFEVPLLALALGDTAAALVGQRFGVLAFDVAGVRRTVEGSSAFAIVTTLVAFMFFHGAGIDITLAALLGITVALVLTVVEAVSVGGWDNLTIPVVGLVVVDLALRVGALDEALRAAVAAGIGITLVVVVAALVLLTGVVATRTITIGRIP